MKLKLDKLAMEPTLHFSEIEAGVTDDSGIEVDIPEDLYNKYKENLDAFLDIQDKIEPYWKEPATTTAIASTARPAARGLLVLEPDLDILVKDLQDRNIRIIQLESNTKIATFEQQKIMLANRILVLLCPREHLELEASSLDMGILVVGDIVGGSASDAAKTISNAIIKYSLWSKRHGFMLTLKDNGQHEYKELID